MLGTAPRPIFAARRRSLPFAKPVVPKTKARAALFPRRPRNPPQCARRRTPPARLSQSRPSQKTKARGSVLRSRAFQNAAIRFPSPAPPDNWAPDARCRAAEAEIPPPALADRPKGKSARRLPHLSLSQGRPSQRQKRRRRFLALALSKNAAAGFPSPAQSRPSQRQKRGRRFLAPTLFNNTAAGFPAFTPRRRLGRGRASRRRPCAARKRLPRGARRAGRAA